MRIPQVGERWQNRKTSRVCSIEVVDVGSDGALAMVAYRYEQRSPNARSVRRQWSRMSEFRLAFSEFEVAR
jgi:hypothetical protein